MERRGKKFLRDERGLSDAVAIGIFIAIALVLAAAIGSVALSRVPQNSAPVVSFSVQTAGNEVLIRHVGGDPVPLADLKIHVYFANNLSSVSGYPISANNTSILRVDNPPTGVLNNGDVIALSLPSGQSYKIAIEHIPGAVVIRELTAYI